MRIRLTSVPIDNLEHASRFYSEVLGFVKKHEIAEIQWVTVVSPEEPDGTELLLEPNGDYPAMKTLKASLVRDGIPITAFQVDHVQAEYERLTNRGVAFTMPPTEMGPTIQAVFDDTCGNLIQIYQVK